MLRATLADADTYETADETPVDLVTIAPLSLAGAFDEGSFIALVEEERLKALAHFADTTSHAVADTTSGASLPGSSVTTYAEAYDCLALLIAAYEAHAGDTTSHGAADTTSFATLVTLTLDDQQEVRAATNEAKSAHNVHLALDTPTHLTPDVTNGVSGADVGYKPATISAELQVEGLNSAGPAGRSWLTRAAYRLASDGTLTQMGSDVPLVDEGDAGAAAWSATLTTGSGSILRVVIVGASSTNVGWSGRLSATISFAT